MDAGGGAAADRTTPSSLADFEFVKKIGSGSFGTVHMVKRKVDNNAYVIKQVKILVMSRKEQETAINEVRILASLDSPHVIKYYDSFIDVDSLNIVMELADHGNLSEWLKQRRNTLVVENTVWKFFLQLVVGIHHIHERNIVHRGALHRPLPPMLTIQPDATLKSYGTRAQTSRRQISCSTRRTT